MATIDDKDVIPEGYVQLKDSERTAPRNAKVVGEVDRHEKFAVTIVLRRREDGPALPDFDYFSKTPPRKRMRLSREEFTEKYGAHPDDLKAIEEFARKSGLTVKSSHAGRRHVVVEGTAAEFSKAFGVSFKHYELPPAPQRKPGPPPRARRYRGRDGFIHVPKDLAESIVGIFGLDNRPVSYRASNPGDPPIVGTLTVQQVTQLYNFPAPGAAIGGQTIGIIAPIGIGGEFGYGGYIQDDIDQTYSALGLTAPQVIPISVDDVVNGAMALVTTVTANTGQSVLTFASTNGLLSDSAGQYTVGGETYGIYVTAVTATTVTLETGLSSDIPVGTAIYFNLDSETNQDICISSLAAQGANIAVYFTNDTQSGWVDMIGRVLMPEAGDFPAGVNPPSVLSASWSIAPGDDPDGLSFADANWGTGVTAATLTAMTAAFQDAAFLQDGPTICIASGDIGSNCYVGSLGTPAEGDGYAHVTYPASDPWVLSVGGTTIGKYQPSGTTTPAWVEFPWNDPFQDPNYPWGTSGGGVSDFFPLPSYQDEAGVPSSINPGITDPIPSTVIPPAPFNNAGRGVPDVAANASINSGYSGFYLGGVLSGVPANGTSAAAPLWAGLIAVLNSNAGFNIGFANPTLYALGAGAFNAINPLWSDPAYPQLATAPTNNGNNGIPGYPTGAGWDAVTGLGSPNGMEILSGFEALESVYILGGYQSPDIILTNLSTNEPVPIGGQPGGRWDTVLEPSTNYGFSANVHNDGPSEANGVVVTFWAIPGGVGTNGSMVGTPQTVNISAHSTVTVNASAPFTSAPLDAHLCAVVSLYSPSSGCAVDATSALQIPNPGYSMTHQCSAWRNTDSMFAIVGGTFHLGLGLGKLPIHLDEPIILGMNTKHVPLEILNTPTMAKIADTLQAVGAKSNQPLYMLPDVLQSLKAVDLRQTVKGVHGIEVKPGKNGEWLLLPHRGHEKTQVEITGHVPARAKKGDVLLMNVSVHYPRIKNDAARTVEFLEFVYVTDQKR
jgi:hypothetical protein